MRIAVVLRNQPVRGERNEASRKPPQVAAWADSNGVVARSRYLATFSPSRLEVSGSQSGLDQGRRLKGLEVLDDRVRRIGEDLGGTVAASYYREGKPEKEIAVLDEEIDAGLIMLGGQRQAPLERIFGANLAEKVPCTAVASKVLHWSLESANRAPLARHHKKDAAARRRTAMPAGCTHLLQRRSKSLTRGRS